MEDYDVPSPSNIHINQEVLIDVSPLEALLKKDFPDASLDFTWDIYSQPRQTWTLLKTSFVDSWNKTIQLSIYNTEEDTQNLLYSMSIDTFVYEASFPLLISSTIAQDSLNKLLNDAKELGVYIDIIWEYNEENIDGSEIMSQLASYSLLPYDTSDYVVIWGEKEFLFSSLSGIYTALWDSQKINFVLVSSYNTSILKNYIWNNISWKDFIDTAFILDNTLLFQILKNPHSISNLQREVENNSYSYTALGENIVISPVLFVSQFVNKLSNMWISNSDIYIILLLPIFLTIIGIAKHMVGISTLWSIIPIFMTLLYIKMGILFVLGLLFFLLIINILISKFSGKYTLLYTPKVSFITIINILAFMLVYNLAVSYEIVHFRIDNILYVALFFIVAEKLITIITSKEFREYKKSITWTVIVSLACLLVYYLDSFRIFLIAYPEILLIFIPINFFLGRFTGLRITEYLRFREIIKSVEEE